MWEINSTGQYLCFVYSIIIGGILGLIYDFLKIDRIVFKRNGFFVFLQDILFWLISAVVFFSFSIVFSNGQIRWYLLFGCFLGFLIYRLTLSKLINLIIIPFNRLIKVIKKWYLKMLKRIFIGVKIVVEKIKKIAKRFLRSEKQKNIKNN